MSATHLRLEVRLKVVRDEVWVVPIDDGLHDWLEQLVRPKHALANRGVDLDRQRDRGVSSKWNRPSRQSSHAPTGSCFLSPLSLSLSLSPLFVVCKRRRGDSDTSIHRQVDPIVG